GEPSLPVRRAWVEAAAGRKVKLVSVSAFDVVHYAGLRPTSEATRGIEVGAGGEVVASLGRTEEGAAFSGTFPTTWARLVRAVFQRETKKAEVIFSPLRWDGAGLELSRRLVVRLDFRGMETAETSRGGSRGRRAAARGSHVRSGVIAQLVVKDRGLYRVDYGDVPLRGEVPTTSLRLSRQGTSVAFHVEPNPARFGPSSSLYFLSEGASLNPYGDAVYELETGALGLQMSEERMAPAASPVLDEQATVTMEENHYYQAGLLDAPDLWLWDLLVSPVSKSYSFTVDHASSLSSGHG